MAWRNYPLSGMEAYQGYITDFSLLNDLSGWFSIPNVTGRASFLAVPVTMIDVDQFLFGDSTTGIKTNPDYSRNPRTNAYLNGSSVLGTPNAAFINAQIGPTSTDSSMSFTIYCVVDDETQKGSFFAITCEHREGTSNYSYNCGYYNTNYMNNETIYQIVTQIAPPIVYSWKSIRSLQLATGDDLGPANHQIVQEYTQPGNTTMLLSYIPDEDLNNGQPVTGGTNYVVRGPSLGDWCSEFNQTSFTNRSLFIKNMNFAVVGRKSLGLTGEQYQFDFKLRDLGTTLYSTTVSVGIGDGTPYLGFIIDEENRAAKLNIIFSKISYDSATGLSNRTVDFNTISMTDTEMNGLYIWLTGTASTDDEDADSSNENPIQGDDETDPVLNQPLNRVNLPTKGAVGSGFVKLYEISDTKLQQLCAFMWDDSLITNLGRLFSDPREIIVGIMVFPFQPTHVTNDVNIYAGNLDTGIQANLLTSEYEEIAAGYARVPKGDADFFSFAPYRKVRIFIPYCGEHELDPSAIYGYKLRLYYHVSFFSGNVIAEVTRTPEDGGTEEPMWFFPGQVGFQIPISGEDFTRTISTLLQAGVNAAAGYLMGNPAAMVKSAGQLFTGNLAPSVQYSQAAGANSAFLGCQQPYLIFNTPKTAYDGSQSQYIGNTYHKTKKLDDCDGFTKCFEAHIENVYASDEELEEISNWLTSGVIISHEGSTTPSDTPTVEGNIVITFMKCISERNVIGKTWTDEHNIEGKLLYDQSITQPKILIEDDIIGYNYCYIGLFKRFYFIKDIVVRKNESMEIDLKSDALQSFAEDILNSDASVDRQKSKGNSFVEDPYKWTQINHDVSIIPFKSTGLPVDFDHINDSYILSIAGT